MSAAVVRSPSTTDLSGLVSLLGELGYPASSQAVAARLDRLAGQANVTVLVADQAGTPVGHALESAPSVLGTSAHLLGVGKKA